MMDIVCHKWPYLFSPQWVSPSGSETETVKHTLLNTMAADALAPGGAKSSAAMILTMKNNQVFVFHEEVFQLPVSSQCVEMVEN